MTPDEPNTDNRMPPIDPQSLKTVDRWLCRTLGSAFAISLFSLFLALFAKSDLMSYLAVLSGGIGMLSAVFGSLYYLISVNWGRLMIFLASGIGFVFLVSFIFLAGMASH